MVKSKTKKSRNEKRKEPERKSKRNLRGTKKATEKSKGILDIDDSEMNELLTEFVEEEKKNTIVKIDENEEELDSLVEEFATAEADCEDEQTKSGAKVVLSSDDEIDDLLDGFEEEE